MMGRWINFRRWLAAKIDYQVPTAMEVAVLEEIANRKFCNTGCRTTKCVRARAASWPPDYSEPRISSDAPQPNNKETK